jgi:hypothetical protein
MNVMRYCWSVMLAFLTYAGCNAMSMPQPLQNLEHDARAILALLDQESISSEDVQINIDQLVTNLLRINAGRNEYLADILIGLQDPEIRKDPKALGIVIEEFVGFIQSGEFQTLVQFSTAAPSSWKSRIATLFKIAGIALIAICLLSAPELAAAKKISPNEIRSVGIDLTGRQADTYSHCSGQCACDNSVPIRQIDDDTYTCRLQGAVGIRTIHGEKPAVCPYCSVSISVFAINSQGKYDPRQDITTAYGTCRCSERIPQE